MNRLIKEPVFTKKLMACFSAKQLLLSFTLFLASFSTHATTVPGFTPGEFSVDASGAANYHIPITVPPGTAAKKGTDLF